MIGRKCGRKYFQTAEVYNKFYSYYKNKSDEDRCIIKAQYLHFKDGLSTLVTGITIIATAVITAIGIYVTKIPKIGYKLHDGILDLILVGILLGSAVLFIGGFKRRVIVRLSIIEKVEKEEKKE